jgi:hypothetical protein
MTERDLSSQLIAASDSEVVSLVYFVKLELDTGTLYLHSSVGAIEFDSQTWSGLGDFGSISAIEESDEGRPLDLTLVLSGLDTNMMNEVLNQDYYLRDVTIYLGALDVDTYELKADPDEIWSGFMDTATTTLGEQNTINIQCENEFAVFNKPNGSAFSDADLQQDYSGDLFFEFLPSMTDAVVVWRGDEATTGTRDVEPNAITKKSQASGRGLGDQSSDSR